MSYTRKMAILTLLIGINIICFAATAAQACITPTFVPPPSLAAYISKGYEPKVIRKPDDMRTMMQLDKYIRDAKYYNALVEDFCTLTPYPMTDRERALNQKLRDVLIEKWAKKEGDK